MEIPECIEKHLRSFADIVVQRDINENANLLYTCGNSMYKGTKR